MAEAATVGVGDLGRVRFLRRSRSIIVRVKPHRSRSIRVRVATVGASTTRASPSPTPLLAGAATVGDLGRVRFLRQSRRIISVRVYFFPRRSLSIRVRVIIVRVATVGASTLRWSLTLRAGGGRAVNTVGACRKDYKSRQIYNDI